MPIPPGEIFDLVTGVVLENNTKNRFLVEGE
jgi:hypothetical protein